MARAGGEWRVRDGYVHECHRAAHTQPPDGKGGGPERSKPNKNLGFVEVDPPRPCDCRIQWKYRMRPSVVVCLSWRCVCVSRRGQGTRKYLSA